MTGKETTIFIPSVSKKNDQINNPRKSMFIINNFNVIGIKNKISKGANKNVNIKLLSIIKL